MVRVCAWCCLFLGLKRPLQRWTVTHGICASCRERFLVGPSGLAPTASQMLVIAQEPLGIEAASELIGRAAYPMVLFADRRRTDRRRKGAQVPRRRNGVQVVERRRVDRRAAPPASWAHGYVVVESATPLELDRELAALTLG